MNKDEAREMFEAVKANRAKIDGCARHRFEIGGDLSLRVAEDE
nr:hypothetical protein PSV3_00195 [Pseudomonas phage PSV3]